MMEDLYISSLRPNEETSILEDMGTSHTKFPDCGKNLRFIREGVPLQALNPAKPKT